MAYRFVLSAALPTRRHDARIQTGAGTAVVARAGASRKGMPSAIADGVGRCGMLLVDVVRPKTQDSAIGLITHGL